MSLQSPLVPLVIRNQTVAQKRPSNKSGGNPYIFTGTQEQARILQGLQLAVREAFWGRSCFLLKTRKYVNLAALAGGKA
jgi:hypothetical protein